MKNLKYLMVALLIVIATSCKKECPVQMISINVEVRDYRQHEEGNSSKTPLALAVKRQLKTNDVVDDSTSIRINGQSYSHVSYSRPIMADVLPDESIVTQIVLSRKSD